MPNRMLYIMLHIILPLCCGYAAVMLLTVFTHTFYVVNTYHIRKTSCDGNAMNVR